MESAIGVFIAGRLGSERLPGKLVLPIGNTCLWEMACEKLNELPDKFIKYVLAEEGELENIAKRFSNLKVIARDPDTAKVDSPLSFIFKDLENVPGKYLMFLNPCQSFITIATIISSLEKFEKSKCDYGTSVKRLQNWVFREDGSSLNFINYRNLSTKEIKPMWQAAHCFHIFDKKQFFEDGYMLKPGHLLLPIPEEETIDVDTYKDYEFVRWKHEICN